MMKNAAFLVLLISASAVPLNSNARNDPENSNAEATPRAALPNLKDLQKRLDDFLEQYYQSYVKSEFEGGKNGASAEAHDIYDRMQSDQPVDNAQKNGIPNSLLLNMTSGVNMTKYTTDGNSSETSYYNRMLRNRAREIWIDMIKANILRQVNRINGTTIAPSGTEIQFNFNQSMFNIRPGNTTDDDPYITEKIRSYYPSCEIPRNTDQEVWKDENTMNLYFNVDYIPEENGISIATATLRLYRLRQENSSTVDPLAEVTCEDASSTDDDKLMRISIYWYTKSLKKHRVKRRLCDSKVIGESTPYVELSVRPATRTWIRGKNLGLAVLVEDQDGTALRADRYFKGASCTVGASTPKPIPTVIIDAARELEHANRIYGPTVLTNAPMLPTIDICTLEIPQNCTPPLNLRINACNLKKEGQQLFRREFLEKHAMVQNMMQKPRHIRHQKQHQLQQHQHGGIDFDDLRSKIVGQELIFTNEQYRNLSTQLQSNNFTTVKR